MAINRSQDKEIKQLYLEMYDKLIAYANSILEDYALAEEAVQETFRIACSKPDKLLSSENPQGWLTKTLKNVMSNIIRGRANLNKLFIALLMSDTCRSDGSYDEIDVDVLYSDLVMDKDYQLLKKIVLEKRTIVEIADELEISVEACTKRVQRAKKSLKGKLLKNQK